MKRCLIALALPLSFGCAHPKHAAVVVDSALFQALNDVHQIEQRALCGYPSCAGHIAEPTVRGWTQAKSAAFNKKLLPAVEGGQQFNHLLQMWRAGAKTPPEIAGLILAIRDALKAVVVDFPAGTTQAAILAKLGEAQQAILAAFSIYLTMGGQ